MLKLLLITLFAASALADTENLDTVVDEILSTVQEEIVDLGYDEISLPDLEGTWSKKVLFVHMSGKLDCVNGTVANLSTIARTGDVTFTSSDDGDNATIAFSFGLDDLEISFGHCHAQVNHLISVSSALSAKVGKNSLTGQLTLSGISDESTCTATVDNFAIDELSDIKLHTGRSVFYEMEEEILNLITKDIEGTIKEQINAVLLEVAQTVIADIDVCTELYDD